MVRRPAGQRDVAAALSTHPAWVALERSRVVGFLALKLHNSRSAEILVMAVAATAHRQGVGRALVGDAEVWCRERDVRWLHVKTRGPSTYDERYEQTRRFYRSIGFDDLYESLTEWGPTDAALVLLKQIAQEGPDE